MKKSFDNRSMNTDGTPSRLVFALEHHFHRDEAGNIYSEDETCSDAFLSRYLDVFDHVTVVARVFDGKPSNGKPIRNGNITFIPLPGYIGPEQYIANIFTIKRLMQEAYHPESVFILRVPGPVETLVWKELKKRGHPYALEVIGDPYDVLGPGTRKHPLRAFFRWRFTRELVAQCKGAAAVSYVTKHTLQKRYKASEGAYETHYSSVELPPDAFVFEPRKIYGTKRPYRIVTVGTLANYTKAPDVMIDAVKASVSDGTDCALTFIGDGPCRPELERRARQTGLNGRIVFKGRLNAGASVRNELDRADLFILPSRTEGLPRALLEAMARALPCIGSDVGGIPEILPPEDRVVPGSVRGLADKIREVLNSPERMAAMSVRNLETARQYGAEILRKRRLAFYTKIKERTEEWLGSHRTP